MSCWSAALTACCGVFTRCRPVIFPPSSLYRVPRERVVYLCNESLACCDSNVLDKVCSGPGPPACKGIYWVWQWHWLCLSTSWVMTVVKWHVGPTMLHLHPNLVVMHASKKTRKPLGSNTTTVVDRVVENKWLFYSKHFVYNSLHYMIIQDHTN